MRYGEWFLGFNEKNLCELLVSHPKIARKIGIPIFHISNNAGIEEIEQTYISQFLANKFENIRQNNSMIDYYRYGALNEVRKLYHSKNGITFTDLEEVISSYPYFDFAIELLSSMREKIASFNKSDNEMMIDIKTYATDLINEGLNNNDWRVFSKLEGQEIEQLIDLKIVSNEFNKIKDCFNSDDVSNQLQPYDNKNEITKIVIGCDHANVKIDELDLKITKIMGGCEVRKQIVSPDHCHHRTEDTFYISNASEHYSIFMNALDLDKLNVLLEVLPNVKTVYDHTWNISSKIYTRDFEHYSLMTRSEIGNPFQGKLNNKESVEHYIKFVELLLNRGIEFKYYASGSNVIKCTEEHGGIEYSDLAFMMSEQELEAIKNDYKEFLLGNKVIPSYTQEIFYNQEAKDLAIKNVKSSPDTTEIIEKMLKDIEMIGVLNYDFDPVVE